jgi:hypothetical protein
MYRECTPEEGQRWQRDHSDGYATGRADGYWHRAPRIELIKIPPDIPGETGAAYVARHVGIAWQIGYSAAYRYARERDLCTSYR